jgi:hypothetical protein
MLSRSPAMTSSCSWTLNISPREKSSTCAAPYFEEITRKCMNSDNWSIAAHILSTPRTLGKSMMQSINMLSHSRSEMGKDCRFLRNYEGCPTGLSYDLLLGSKFRYANLSLLRFRTTNRSVYFCQEICPQLMVICSFKVHLQVFLVTQC